MYLLMSYIFWIIDNLIFIRRFGMNGSCQKREEVKSSSGRALPEVPPIQRLMVFSSEHGASGGG